MVKLPIDVCFILKRNNLTVKEKTATMWQFGVRSVSCTLLANIYSFVIQNLTQHIHCTDTL